MFKLTAKHSGLLSLGVWAVAGLTGCGGAGGQDGFPASASAPAGYRLVWSDEFDSTAEPKSLNAALWDFDLGNNNGWGNNERQVYTSSLGNAYLKDGVLNIVAKDDGNGGFTSARITNRPAAVDPYGYYEIRAKLPCGTGAWPSIWLLGDKPTKTNGKFDPGIWPSYGEIDMVEWMSRYFDINTVQATVHFDYLAGSPTPAAPQGYLAGLDNSVAQFYGAQTKATSVCGDWHVYHMVWTHDSIRIGIDGYYYMQFLNPTPNTANMSKWPFDNPHHLILNVAVGGNLGGQYYNAVTGQRNVPNVVDYSHLPFTMQVDYVRVYRP